MAGKKIDMLNGSLWDKILFYAIPLAITGILQQLMRKVRREAPAGLLCGPAVQRVSGGRVSPLYRLAPCGEHRPGQTDAGP